jgi:ferredoxin
MPQQPKVDEELCIGCGLIDEKSNVVGPDQCGTCNCQEAIDTCPVQAITWEA